MKIGVPKEIKNHEYRVGLTPASVRELTSRGHEVLVQTGAGAAIGLTDEACSAVYGWCEGEISRKYLEESEVIEVVLADREEAKRILKEENVAIMCSYHLMHFIHDEEPFAFLK